MTTVISVRFRGGCKTYYFDPQGLTISTGEDVIVDTAQGTEYAQCVEGNHPVEDGQVVQPLRRVVRVATENDRRTVAYHRHREKEAFEICQKKILQHGLEMKLVRVECSFDGNKILFFFTADGRVDFRELVKDLAGVFRARIELRQIGVRDEAKMLGGLGICGRPFCCSQFMDEFMPVSIKMAKTQNLSLNPTKISGTCGRLMCCLKYEQDAYEDALKRLPKNESFVQTPDGPGNVTDVNVLKEMVTVRLDEQPESPHRYRTCEVQVLRNGKGSRDGIVVPKERPERYVEECVEEEVPLPLMVSDFNGEEPDGDKHDEVHRRRRGRRGGHKSSDGEKAAPMVEKKELLHEKAESKKSDKSAAPKNAESRRYRSRRRGTTGKNAEAKPVVKVEKATKPEAAAQMTLRRHSHHRGGRRHNGKGGATSKNAE